MSELWRLLLVEDDDYLNQSIVNSLRKDGYIVQGVRSGAEAIRLVWSEEYDVVIGDLRTPGADGFEMLQWLRSFRPKTRMIMVAASTSAADRTQALRPVSLATCQSLWTSTSSKKNCAACSSKQDFPPASTRSTSWTSF